MEFGRLLETLRGKRSGLGAAARTRIRIARDVSKRSRMGIKPAMLPVAEDVYGLIMLGTRGQGCYCSIVVSTSDCGSENPGSNPGSGNFLNKHPPDSFFFCFQIGHVLTYLHSEHDHFLDVGLMT